MSHPFRTSWTISTCCRPFANIEPHWSVSWVQCLPILEWSLPQVVMVQRLPVLELGRLMSPPSLPPPRPSTPPTPHPSPQMQQPGGLTESKSDQTEGKSGLTESKSGRGLRRGLFKKSVTASGNHCIPYVINVLFRVVQSRSDRRQEWSDRTQRRQGPLPRPDQELGHRLR